MIKISKQSAGFTLIEMMIGLLLTSLFIGGIAQVFSNTSKSFKTQRALSYMMEDARFALDKLNSEFRRAGFLTNRQVAGGNAIFHADAIIPEIANRIRVDFSFNGGVGSYGIRNAGAAGTLPLLTMGVNEVVKGAVNPNGPVSDSVIIRYQLSRGADLASNQLSPCTRNLSLDIGELMTERIDRHIVVILFYVAFDPIAGSNSLYCKAFRENIGTTVVPGNIVQNPAPSAIALISNVERFRVLYGETNVLPLPAVPPLPALQATVYRAYDQVGDWTTVRSVRLSIALRSEASNISVDDPGNYTINGQLSISPTAADIADKRLYRVFSTTVNLR